MAAYEITIWCESDKPEYDLAMALEQGELWDMATDVQYQIVQSNTDTCDERKAR
jgi:hypothetical protein